MTVSLVRERTKLMVIARLADRTRVTVFKT